MIVGDKVLLYPSHIIDTLTDNVGRQPEMEAFFGTVVTVSEIGGSKKSFKIAESSYWFSTNWINLEHTCNPQSSIFEITKITSDKQLIYFKELGIYVYDSPNGVIQLTKEQTL